ncbi:molybdenum cofactor biosynthesis protein MoaE [Brevibacterium yomogidense]|uniref:molybdenum cofactor biosynthesis protein MoaE n=1 Tax=Brevibacterium yomogidense TaxID=946573 RepID=UPI001E3DCC88|nr:molybdenum cofactor biosynthesis protein MoaE [Brevibacterium yomogidense]
MTRVTRPDADRRPRRATRGGDRSATFGEGRRAVVLVVSSSAAAGTAEDYAGPLLVGWLAERGYLVDGTHVVADGPAVGAALRHHLHERPEAERPRVLVTTGGTGLAPDDWTPEETRKILDKEASGLVQALIDHGMAKLPEAAMSRGTAGSSGRTFVVNLPGSVGGVKDGITVLDPILHHIQAQLEGGADNGVHPPRDAAAAEVAELVGAAGVGGVHASGAHGTGTGGAHVSGDGNRGDDVGAGHEDVVGAGPDVGAQSRGSAESQSGAVSGDGESGGDSGSVLRPFASGLITDKTLCLAAAEARVKTPHTGAVAVFRGVVRDHDSGRGDVVGLEYTAHPAAQSVLDEVLADALVDFPRVRLWAEHRIGELVIGDDALLVVAASAHRKEAFTACAELVDRIKDRVPIWKRQDYANGDHDWVGIE